MADALSVKIDDLITGADALSAAADSIATITSGSDVVVSNFDHVEEVFDNLQDFLAELKAGSWYAPVGLVSPFAGASAPAGWLLCNGDTVPNGSGTVQSKTADYAELYALLSSTYGSAGKLPDLRGRVVAGVDFSNTDTNRLFTANNSAANRGSVVGDYRPQQHTHTQNAHAHSFNVQGSFGWVGIGETAVAGSSTGPNWTLASSPVGSTTATNQNTFDGSQQNVQPTMMLNYIIKA